jgi:tetratricopeptide (TPR) repeat protein
MRFCCVLLVWVWWPHLATARPKNASLAQFAYQAGELAYKRGEFNVACERFEQAYELSQFPTILFDVAQAYRRLYETEHHPPHLEKAVTAYRNFLRDAPQDAPQRPLAQNFLGLLELQEKTARSTPTEPKPVVEPTPVVTATAPRVPATTPERRVPVYRKWWLWTLVGVSSAALVVGLGVGLGVRNSDPTIGTTLTWDPQ